MPKDVERGVTTLGCLLASTTKRMRQAGIEDAGREARRLIGALTGIASEMFLAHPELPVSQANCALVSDGLGKRVAGMPIGRIVGEREFYGRPFILGPAILEPRADSEVLIDAALEIVARDGLQEAPLRIVDIGTGSGCLLITLLAELPSATGLGVDISVEALSVATDNARRNGVSDRAEFTEGDALTGVTGEFDLVISNPPYICSDELAGLAVEVRAHDPLLALDGGPDGLEIYRRIARDVMRVSPNGWIVLEAGAGMADAICHEIDRFGEETVRRDWEVWHDLNGHARCVAAKTLYTI